MRLLSMIGMLTILGLIIARAADPRTWAWLAEGDSASSRNVTQATDVHGVQSSVTKWQETVTPGLTDEDIEELEAATEEFQALTDGGLELSGEEMPAYWRLFDWVQHQSTTDLRKRASNDIVFNQFIRSPEEQRGKLFRLELNVRRILSYPAPPNRAGIKTVHEIWGWTTESKAWLFEVLTNELPPGTPVGTDIYERMSFTGYFYKIQGYHAAGASPGDKPIPAPLFIGRVTWHPSELRMARAQPQDWSWLWWVGGLAIAFGVARLGLWIYGRRKPARRQGLPAGADKSRDRHDVQQWLATCESAQQSAELADHGDDMRLPSPQNN